LFEGQYKPFENENSFEDKNIWIFSRSI
jgi:hypothetical protein